MKKRFENSAFDRKITRAKTPPRVAPRLKAKVKNRGIKPVRKPKSGS